MDFNFEFAINIHQPSTINYQPSTLSSVGKEKISNHNRRNNRCEVGEQRRRNSITDFFYAHGTKIQGSDIKSGIRRALENTRELAGKRIRAIGLHGIDHHGSPPAPAQRSHQSRWQRRNKIGIYVQHNKKRTDGLYDIIKHTATSEHADGHQHTNQVGNDGHCYLEALFRTVNKGFINIDLFNHAADDENGKQQHDKPVAEDV